MDNMLSLINGSGWSQSWGAIWFGYHATSGSDALVWEYSDGLITDYTHNQLYKYTCGMLLYLFALANADTTKSFNPHLSFSTKKQSKKNKFTCT